MGGLNHCAGVGGEAAGAGGGDSEGHLSLGDVQTEDLGAGGGPAEGADHAGRMEGRIGGRGRGGAHPALDVPAEGVGFDDGLSRGVANLAQGKRGGEAGGGAVGGREALNLVVQAVAEDAVGEGSRGSVGTESPANYAAVRGAPQGSSVLADDVGEFLGGAGDHVGYAVKDGDLGRCHGIGGELVVGGGDDELREGPGCVHGWSPSGLDWPRGRFNCP